jgi:hypothetical protein
METSADPRTAESGTAVVQFCNSVLNAKTSCQWVELSILFERNFCGEGIESPEDLRSKVSKFVQIVPFIWLYVRGMRLNITQYAFYNFWPPHFPARICSENWENFCRWSLQQREKLPELTTLAKYTQATHTVPQMCGGKFLKFFK